MKHGDNIALRVVQVCHSKVDCDGVTVVHVVNIFVETDGKIDERGADVIGRCTELDLQG